MMDSHLAKEFSKLLSVQAFNLSTESRNLLIAGRKRAQRGSLTDGDGDGFGILTPATNLGSEAGA
jgi:hypothetical protein